MHFGPVHCLDSRDLFVFERENPTNGRKQQYRWTVLPQGFMEAPNLFGQILESILENFEPVQGTQLLQYVDDLLISGREKTTVSKTTRDLLNFLGQKGLRVSRNKLQFVEKEVKYLGHLISEGKQRINPERIAGIIKYPKPKQRDNLENFWK